MKFLKKVLIVTATLTIVVVGGYFINQAVKFNGKKYPIEQFEYEIFETTKKDEFINFGSLNKIGLYFDKTFYTSDDYSYVDNNLIITINNTEYHFYVIDDETIYSKTFNKYFYKYNEEEIET